MRRFAAIITALITALCTIARTTASGYEAKDAEAALLIDVYSQTVIYEKNAYEKRDTAGLVRLPVLLTICRAFDTGNANEEAVTTVSKEAASIRGSTAFIREGERIKLGELLKAAVIINAGDALHALLQGIFGSDSAILEAENTVLSELGLPLLTETTGSGSVFSLHDLSKVCVALSESPAFLKYSSVYTDTLPHDGAAATELTNPNRLVRFYSGCFGLATGSIGSSNYCGAFIAGRGGSVYLALVAGARDSSSRFNTASGLLDHAFSNYRHIELAEKGESAGVVTVIGGIKNSVEAVTADRTGLLVSVSCKKLLSEPLIPESIEAPVHAGDTVGELVIKDSEGNTVAIMPLVASESVEKARFSDWFSELVASWLKQVKADPSD